MFIESHNSLDIIHEDLNNEHGVKVNIFPKVCLEFIKLRSSKLVTSKIKLKMKE